MSRLFICAASLCLALSLCCCDKNRIPTEDRIRQMLIGKWRSHSTNGVPMVTDEMKICTFSNESTYYSTESRPPLWHNKFKWKYEVRGTAIYYEKDEDADIYVESVHVIGEDRLVTANTFWKHHPEQTSSDKVEYIRITRDYSKGIIGLWEGVSLEGEQTYGDANHRFDYRKDGTFTYFVLDDNNEWTPGSNTRNEYIADGDYLATRWFDQGAEYREWWLIEECSDTEMTWSAIRQREDGTRFNTRMKLKRIN